MANSVRVTAVKSSRLAQAILRRAEFSAKNRVQTLIAFTGVDNWWRNYADSISDLHNHPG